MEHSTCLSLRIPLAIFMLQAFASAGIAQYGDFNADGIYDCADIDALVAEIAAGGNNQLFDLNGDGGVDISDRDEWLAGAGAENLASGNSYIPGDANLDGLVDVRDFFIWNQNKFTQTAAWCSGDFNADGSVDVGDFNVWNGNIFTSSRIANSPEEPIFTDSGNLHAIPLSLITI